MDQRRKARTTLLSEYRKFHFGTKEKADEVKKILEEHYPCVIFKVSNAGSLFYKFNGSLVFDLELADKVHALGGVEA